MKKLALIATAAVVALPLSANAAERQPGKWYDDATTADVTVERDMILTKSPFIPDEGETLILDLENTDDRLFLKGKTAYIVEPDGNMYYAGYGLNKTTSGLVYQIIDGEALYVEAPRATTYTFVADARDEDRDGMTDDVDFSMITTPRQ